MSNWYARAVFFVEDVQRSQRFYVDQLGFSEDWNSNDGVLQVSLHGFEVILNEVGDTTKNRIGHGRVFIGLEDDQIAAFREHVATKNIPTERVQWGRPTLVIRDVDGNEMLFWDWPEKDGTTKD